LNNTAQAEKENDLKDTKHSGANDSKDNFQNTLKVIAEIEYLSWCEQWLQVRVV